MFFKKGGWKKLVIPFMVLGLILGFCSFLVPGTASAAGNPVSIKLDGELKKTFSWEELEDMKGSEAWVGPRVYSTINTWPTKKWYAVEGVKLMSLIESAEVFEDTEISFDDIQVIKVKAIDGYVMTFTKKELFDDPRYYYPGLKANHEYFGEIPGDPYNPEPEQVEAIIALKSVENSDNFNYMSPLNCPLFVLGQRWVTEQTNHTFVKTVGEIDLLTTPPQKWIAPTATPGPGAVPVGTEVVLTNQFNDADKIYYTTDGTDPTLRSPIYNWIASRWWGSREKEKDTINKPIVLTEDTTIKAITIGFGYENSEIVTFEYTVYTVDVTGVKIIPEGDQELEVGETVQLNAEVEPENATNKDVTWSTSNENVATVSESGLVTAISEGEATITVTTIDGGHTASIKVTVEKPPPVLVTGVTISEGDQELEVGETVQLNAEVEPENATNKDVTWSTSNENVATVSESGLVTAISEGEATITVTTIDGGYTDSIKVNVLPAVDVFEVVEGVLIRYTGAGGDLIIPDDLNITSIGDDVFAELNTLTSVVIPEGVTSIGASAFYECSNLSTVIIPESVTHIKSLAFYACSSLTSVSLPENLTYIGGNAFNSCSSLSKIIIPRSVEFITISAFVDCDQLTIYGYRGSYAETFAVENEIPFVALSESPYESIFNVVPVEDDVYTIGETEDGIKTMTVNENQTGLKYFSVSIESIEPHEGTETVIFTHLRDGIQLELNSLEADFDKVSVAKAGFNVNPGDVIKVYIVDKLTNDSNSSPIILQ
jgi:uncharacterized protein YjdB